MYTCIIRSLMSLLLLISLVSCNTSKLNNTTALNKPAAPKAGDCNSCHEGMELLPSNHVDTRDMTLGDCTSCHEPEGDLSLRKKLPLSHAHKLGGVSCSQCHEDPASPSAVDQTVCLECHSDTAKLFEATGSLELNPHFSPHEGKISDCNRCHHQHKESENYCSRCHNME